MANRGTTKKAISQRTSNRRTGVHLGVAERRQTMEVFLSTFAQTGNFMLSCRAANIGRAASYDYLDRDADGFAARYADAEQEACEALEAEAYRRGVQGIDKPIHFKGQRVDTVREYSDTLLIFLMKGRMPHKYRDSYDGDAPPPPGSRASAQASANVAVFNIGGQVKRPEEMTEDELQLAERALGGEAEEG